MIPYRDDNPTRSWAFVNFAIIAANVGLFVWAALQPSYAATLCRWGAFAADITGAPGGGPGPCPAAGGAPAYYAAFTHMYFHGGVLHLLGNLLFLGVFGNNIEDAIGHRNYLLFYTLCGLAALGAQVVAYPASNVPMVGASGAIAGVLGAYLLLFPLARVHVIIPIVVIPLKFALPAVVLLAFWFAMQVVNGMLDSAYALTGGVAWHAHIGGFVAGVILVLLFPKKRKRRR